MSSNYSISFTVRNRRIMGLEVLMGLDKKTHGLFTFVITRCSGELYIAGEFKDRACETLKFSGATYWRKLKKLEDSGLLVNSSRGIYRVNSRLVKIVKDAHEAYAKVKEEILKQK